jgi:hypothetical protein
MATHVNKPALSDPVTPEPFINSSGFLYSPAREYKPLVARDADGQLRGLAAQEH